MSRLSPALRQVLDVAELLVDPEVGILRGVSELRREAGAPEFFHFSTRCCNTRAFSRQTAYSGTGAASTDRDAAASHAILQAVACYCAALYYPDDLRLESAESAPFPCVPPEQFALYSAKQMQRPGFPWAPFDARTRLCWTPAVDPLAGDTCFVPAAMVFLPYSFDVFPGDSPIAQPMSTGLACGTSPALAAVAAISEIVECDALTIVWQARLGMPQIRIETLSDVNYDIVSRFEKTGSSVRLLNVTLDLGIPTVLACLRSNSAESPALLFSAGCALDPEAAVRGSLEELAHAQLYSQSIVSQPTPGAAAPGGEDPMDHQRFWCAHEHAPLADFLFTSKDRIEFDEIPDLATGTPESDLQLLLQKLRDAGHRALIADRTTDDVRSLGLTVARAIVPGLHPLFLGHEERALGGSRLFSVPQRLGYGGITPETGDNLLPHPYF